MSSWVATLPFGQHARSQKMRASPGRPVVLMLPSRESGKAVVLILVAKPLRLV
jgi:hypothetical protein